MTAHTLEPGTVLAPSTGSQSIDLTTTNMASVLNFINRNRLSMYPPQVHKSKDALKFGILGAAKIGSAFQQGVPSLFVY